MQGVFEHGSPGKNFAHNALVYEQAAAKTLFRLYEKPLFLMQTPSMRASTDS